MITIQKFISDMSERKKEKENKMAMQKIDKEKVYKVLLSGAQIIWIQTILTQAMNLNLSEKGETISEVLYQTLEEESEEVK